MVNYDQFYKIIQNLPEDIEEEISYLSPNIDIFNTSKDHCYNALSASGFHQESEFQENIFNKSTDVDRNIKSYDSILDMVLMLTPKLVNQSTAAGKVFSKLT